MTEIVLEAGSRENGLKSDSRSKSAPRDGGSAARERVVKVTPPSIAAYREEFALQPEVPSWLDALRRQGIERFEALGYPTTKNEDWHFTSVAPIAERTFSLATVKTNADASASDNRNRRGSSRRKEDALQGLSVKASELQEFGFGEDSWHTLVFVNGVFTEALSAYSGAEQAVRITDLSTAIRDGGESLSRHLGKIAPFEDHTFTALNTAFIRDGAVIEIQPDADIEKPIHLLFVTEGDGVCHPRNLIVAGRNSRATVIESYVSVRDHSYFTNAVTELVLDDGAHLDHYKIQRESQSAFHVGTVQARQGRNSELHSFSFAVGGALARTNIYTSLDGDAATCTLNGLYLTDGSQHIDNQTSIEHIAPNCPSHELYKGVLDGRSHGVFNGKVYVHPEAQKTDGKQSNNNLLLSPTARVDTKPQLEIFADDVKCTHGATVGRLDDVAMFYLNSRGIGADAARMLLTYAFAADVLETIPLEPVKKELERIVLSRFADSKLAAGV
ncbi:MAG TPA: Fe-S cluster assembly protein SufD [Gemmatimonadaceae bacterium]|nr:Fe-S cluster assembly protein SufD [Gemmatimonadaceae bacterium]